MLCLFNRITWERCDFIEIKECFVLISAGFLVFPELADDQFGERFHVSPICLVKWIVLIQRVLGCDSLKCKPAAWLSKLCSIVITGDKVFKDEYRQSKVEVCVLLWLAQSLRIQHLISHFGNWTVKVYHYKIFSKKLKVNAWKNIFKIVLIPLWVGLEMFVGPETRKISRCQPQRPRGTDTIPVRQSTLQKLRIKHFLIRDSCSPCDPARCSLPGTSPGRRRPQSSPDSAPACSQLRQGGSWTQKYN